MFFKSLFESSQKSPFHNPFQVAKCESETPQPKLSDLAPARKLALAAAGKIYLLRINIIH